MQLIFYYVMGHRANANKLTDRCNSEKKKYKKKKKTGDTKYTDQNAALTEGPLRHIIIATFALHHSPLWKRVIAWERSRAASGYGIIWGDADRNKQEEFSAECHSVDWF